MPMFGSSIYPYMLYSMIRHHPGLGMDLTSPSLFKPTSNRAQISQVTPPPPPAAASPSRRDNSEEHQPWVAGGSRLCWIINQRALTWNRSLITCSLRAFFSLVCRFRLAMITGNWWTAQKPVTGFGIITSKLPSEDESNYFPVITVCRVDVITHRLLTLWALSLMCAPPAGTL